MNYPFQTLFKKTVFFVCGKKKDSYRYCGKDVYTYYGKEFFWYSVILILFAIPMLAERIVGYLLYPIYAPIMRRLEKESESHNGEESEES